MRLTSTLAGALLCGLAAASACGTPDGKVADAKDAKDVTAPTKGPTEPPAAVAGAHAIGIPECDEFIAKFARCIEEKVPAGGRAQAQTAMDAMVKGFKDTAAGSGRDQLPQTCKATMDSTKQSMTAMGCTW